MNSYILFLLIVKLVLIKEGLGVRLEKHDIEGDNIDEGNKNNINNSICELKQQGDECRGEVAKLDSSIKLGLVLSIKTEYYLSENELVGFKENYVKNNDKRRYLGKNFNNEEERELMKDRIVESKIKGETASEVESNSNKTSQNGNEAYSGIEEIDIRKETSNNTISKIISPTEDPEKNVKRTIDNNETFRANSTYILQDSVGNESTYNETLNYLNGEMNYNTTDNTIQLKDQTTYENHIDERFIGGNKNSLKKPIENNYKSEINDYKMEMNGVNFINQTNNTSCSTLKECLSDSLITYNITYNNETKYLLVIKKKQIILLNTVLHENAPTIGHNSDINRLPLLLEATNNDISQSFEEKIADRKKSKYHDETNNSTEVKLRSNYVESISIFNFPIEFPALKEGQGEVEINLMQTSVSFYAYIRLSVTLGVQNETLRLFTTLITSSIGTNDINYICVNSRNDVKLTLISFRLEQSEEFLKENYNSIINPNYEVTRQPPQRSFWKSIFTSRTDNKSNP
ncbi:hypothetical protein FG386_003147 [Cryptosporidium ryanae]|uniref:uncharacterized protein n=1 Tax=Cryptosporidium ryanae TaxID=515981 RepID=UPI00351A3E1D|nr:hypothetical protein FG386_003147 [Cryptosporidium ryanae]